MEIDDLRPDACWVTPTRRLAHYLRRRFDEACTGQGLEVWHTPDVVTWSALVERLFALERQAGRVAGRWLPDSAARLVWERIVERDPATAGLVSPGLLGRPAYESWRRMHAYQIPPEVIAAGDTPETAAFARWAEEYAAFLDRHGWVDESRAVARLSPDASGMTLEFIGFDALTPAQQSYLQRLERSGATVSHRLARADSRVHSLGRVRRSNRRIRCGGTLGGAATRATTHGSSCNRGARPCRRAGRPSAASSSVCWSRPPR